MRLLSIPCVLALASLAAAAPQQDLGARATPKTLSAEDWTRQAATLTSDFARWFPGGVVLGDTDGPDGDAQGALVLSSAADVLVALNTQPQAAATTIQRDQTGTRGVVLGALARQLLTAKLNLAHDAANARADLAGHTFAASVPRSILMLRVDQVMQLADRALAGEFGHPVGSSGNARKSVDVDGNGAPDLSLTELATALEGFNKSFTATGAAPTVVAPTAVEPVAVPTVPAGGRDAGNVGTAGSGNTPGDRPVARQPQGTDRAPNQPDAAKAPKNAGKPRVVKVGGGNRGQGEAKPAAEPRGQTGAGGASDADATLERDRERVRAEIERLRTKLERARGERNSAVAEAEELRKKNSELEREVSNLHKEVEGLRERVKALRGEKGADKGKEREKKEKKSEGKGKKKGQEKGRRGGDDDDDDDDRRRGRGNG